MVSSLPATHPGALSWVSEGSGPGQTPVSVQSLTCSSQETYSSWAISRESSSSQKSLHACGGLRSTAMIPKGRIVPLVEDIAYPSRYMAAWWKYRIFHACLANQLSSMLMVVLRSRMAFSAAIQSSLPLHSTPVWGFRQKRLVSALPFSSSRATAGIPLTESLMARTSAYSPSVSTDLPWAWHSSANSL